jgi:hypothetical protein
MWSICIHTYVRREKQKKYYFQLLSMFSICGLFINSKEAMIDETEIQALESSSSIHRQQHFY